MIIGPLVACVKYKEYCLEPSLALGYFFLTFFGQGLGIMIIDDITPSAIPAMALWGEACM